MADYTPELKRLLREAGCYFERQGRGDYEICYSPITDRRFLLTIKSSLVTPLMLS
jgi:hypothetical protein